MEMTLGRFVRDARRAKGLSQAALCSVVALSNAYISRMENDHIGYASEDSCVRIANALDIDADETVRLAGKVPSDIEDYLIANPREMQSLRKKVRRVNRTRS